jgi:hypothetical protein
MALARAADFSRQVPLPPGLTIAALRNAVDYIERELTDLIDIYHEQANIFSALVGIFGIKALDTYSVYEKHRHIDIAQQRFPDLRRKGSGPNPSPMESLESKASKRVWDLQSHYDHPGWYIVWRYLVDTTRSIEPGKALLIWRIDIAFIEKNDWKYEGSSAGKLGGGRTHTFGLRAAAGKLRGKAVYSRSDVVVKGGKPIPANGS